MNTVLSGNLRVVLDTNVYVSAFTHSTGQSARVWAAARDQHYSLLISPPIIREIAGVLRRPKFAWKEEEIANRVKLIVKTAAAVITPTLSLTIIHEDPPDDRILECAVEGQANLIVSGNRHLKRLKSFEGIAIINPTTFLRTLGVPEKRERR